MSPDTPTKLPASAGQTPAEPQAPPLPPLGKRPRLHSEHLFRGGDEVEIVHGQALYRLRITSLGKLILTK